MISASGAFNKLKDDLPEDLLLKFETKYLDNPVLRRSHTREYSRIHGLFIEYIIANLLSIDIKQSDSIKRIPNHKVKETVLDYYTNKNYNDMFKLAAFTNDRKHSPILDATFPDIHIDNNDIDNLKLFTDAVQTKYKKITHDLTLSNESFFGSPDFILSIDADNVDILDIKCSLHASDSISNVLQMCIYVCVLTSSGYNVNNVYMYNPILGHLYICKQENIKKFNIDEFTQKLLSLI